MSRIGTICRSCSGSHEMNERIRFTLTTDGSLDKVLLHPLLWLLRRHAARDGILLDPQWADLRALRVKPKGLAERIHAAQELYPCDLLFVHRDAEKGNPGIRFQEIDEAKAELSVDVSVVPVVPVR